MTRGEGLLAVLLAAALPPSGAAQVRAPESPDSLPHTYLDETARTLILGARAARDTALLAIDSYTALMRERMTVEWPSRTRSRPFVSGEQVSRIRWARGEPAVVRILGLRIRPSYATERWLPEAARHGADPLRDPFSFGIAALSGGRATGLDLLLSPLDPEAERHYRFSSGDTIAVELPGGRSVRVVEVTAMPRFRTARLVAAVLWIEPESFGLARVAFRLAKRLDSELEWQLRTGGRWRPGLRLNVPTADMERDTSLAEGPGTTAPGGGIFSRLVNALYDGLIPPMAFDIETVVADYQLWDLRHWLPRAVRWEGYFGGGQDAAPSGRPPPVAPMKMDWTFEVENIRARGGVADPASPATAAEAVARWAQTGDSVDGDPESVASGEIVVIAPRDRDRLDASPLLPPPVGDAEMDGSVGEDALERIRPELATIVAGEYLGGPPVAAAASPWTFYPPFKTLWLLRYNDVQGFAVGTGVVRDLGWGRSALTVHLGTREPAAPDLALTLMARPTPGLRVQGSLYRRLGGVSVLPDDPGGFLVRGGDASDYFRATGAAVHFLPGAGERDWLSLRVFAERETPVVEGPGRDRYGVQADWKPWRGGISREAVGGGGRLSLRGVAGDSPHVKAMATGVLAAPLGGGFSLGLEAGAARVWGSPETQDLWPLAATGAWLRGHVGVARAKAVWRGRVDVQRQLRFAGVAVFGDWASADGADHIAAGIGLVLFDGMIRLDLARGLDLGGPALAEPSRRHLHFRADSFF